MSQSAHFNSQHTVVGQAKITFTDTPVPERGGEMGVNSSSSETPRVLLAVLGLGFKAWKLLGFGL